MANIETLKKYLSSYLSIPPLEWTYFAQLLKVRHIEKDEFLFRQGDRISDVGFVLQGLLCNFYTHEKGKIAVKYFTPEGSMVACYSGLLQNSPAGFSCQVLEKCLLVYLKYEELLKLYDRHACWEKMGRISAENLYIEKEKREFDFLTSDADTRYTGFVKANALIIDRVPQDLIASYLGISPVSLSRLRKKRV